MSMTDDDVEIERQHDLEVETNDIELDNLLNPFHFVEPCEPECSPERHTYHQGQWDMAGRICRAWGVLPNPVDAADIPKLLDAHYLGVFLELVGEDEIVDTQGNVGVMAIYQGRNILRTQLRAAANKRLGGVK